MSPLEQLKSVLCDPEGTCCIAGSDEDRAIIDRALQALAAQQEPVTWLENLKRLASICPELPMVTYSEEDVDDLNCWAIEVATCIDGIATPPAAQRKPLTDEQIEKCTEAADSKWADAFVPIEWARHLTKAIEAAHGIKETTK
jgi:hypothetical protein